LVFSLAFAQDFISEEKPFTKDRLTQGPAALGLTQASSSGLLDPSRFSMRQSYSMSYVTNGSQGDMTGLYLNRMQYNFSIPLTLQVDVGYFHKPLALAGEQPAMPGAQNQTLTVPRVGLIYQPSENLFMSFEYFNVPAGYGNAFMPFGGDPVFGLLPPARKSAGPPAP
jgi:hypothetical protein